MDGFEWTAPQRMHRNSCPSPVGEASIFLVAVVVHSFLSNRASKVFEHHYNHLANEKEQAKNGNAGENYDVNLG